MMTRTLVLLLLFSVSISDLFSQNPGENDLYMFNLQKSSKGDFHLYGAKFLSGFNRGGYTNQPWFTPSGDILVSMRASNETQNDIWLLSPATKKRKRLTSTKAMEYSPRIHPDEEHLTFLRKVGEEPLDQQVYKVNLKSGAIESTTMDVRDIGYYTWMGMDALGIYRIDDAGNKLSYFDIGTQKSRRITSSIGRTLLSDKNGLLIYVHKFSNEYWYIKKYDPASSVMEIVTQTIGKNEDFTISRDGTYFMANNHLLYSFNPTTDKGWKQFADLSTFGIKYASRLAISPDGKQIVVVATKEKS
jgi:Tol biopolymer transport system component